MNIGETIELGPYTVRAAMRPDNPAFACFIIFRGPVLIGRQFSVPDESACQWLEQRKGEYASSTRTVDISAGRPRLSPSAFEIHTSAKRRGRPTNAERARRAALTPPEEEENSFA